MLRGLFTQARSPPQVAAFCCCQRIGVLTFAFVLVKSICLEFSNNSEKPNNPPASIESSHRVSLLSPAILGRICGGSLATVVMEERFKYQHPQQWPCIEGCFNASG